MSVVEFQSRGTDIVVHVTLSGTAEGFDCKNLSLFHLRLVTTLDDGHTLSTMDDMLVDVVSIQIPDTFHRIGSTADLDFVALHRFLDGSSDVTHTDVDTGFLCRGQLPSSQSYRGTINAREYRYS